MEARLHRLSIPHASVLAVALFVAALVALAVAILVGGRVNEPLPASPPAQATEPAFVPTGLGRAYDAAVGGLVRTNHELESRQARLAAALTSGAPAQRVELMRRQVRALERDYARAVTALAADSSARR